MRKLILLGIGMTIQLFLSAQTLGDKIKFTKEDATQDLRIDIEDGESRDVEFTLYKDEHYAGNFDLNNDAVEVGTAIGTSEYKVIAITPMAGLDFGIATVMDVDMFNLNTPGKLGTFFNNACARTDVKGFLISQVLFTKECVCAQFNQMGANYFFTLYNGHFLDDYLIANGCQATGTLAKKASTSLAPAYIAAQNDVITLPNPSPQSKNYTIYDMSGKFITGSVCCENKIDVSSLIAGVYFIKVNAENTQEMYKFVK